MHGAMGTTAQVKQWLKNLDEVSGCETSFDAELGIALAASEGETCFRAIQKGRNGPWIIMFMDGGHVSWRRPPLPGENKSAT